MSLYCFSEPLSLPYFSQLTRCWSLERSSVLPTPMTTPELWPLRRTNPCCGQWLSRDKLSYRCHFWSDTTRITTKFHWIKTVKLLQDISRHWFSVLNEKESNIKVTWDWIKITCSNSVLHSGKSHYFIRRCMSSHSVQPQTKMNVKKLLLLIWLVQATFTKYFIPILNYFSPHAKRKYSTKLHIV